MSWMIAELDQLVDFLRSKGELYGPAGEEKTASEKTASEMSMSEKITFQGIEDPARLNLTRPSDVSARHLFQPMTHYFLRFEEGPDPQASFADYETSSRIVLGLRPCDVKALQVHDRVFQESGSYRRLRESTVIVGWLCPRRERTCFCDAFGIHPHSTEGMDIALYPATEGGFVLTAVTEKGQALMADAPFESREQISQPAFQEEDHPSLEAEGLAEALEGIEDDSVWEEIGFACVNCRVCTYVCPTCHCFTVTDEVFRSRGGRAVVWDSCQNELFTKEASGHNPRGAPWARVRQRILHKFHWYPRTFGEIMCTGCGRCIAGCPTGRNIAEELTLLKEVRTS